MCCSLVLKLGTCSITHLVVQCRIPIAIVVVMLTCCLLVNLSRPCCHSYCILLKYFPNLLTNTYIEGCEEANYHEAMNMIFWLFFWQAYSEKYEGADEHLRDSPLYRCNYDAFLTQIFPPIHFLTFRHVKIRDSHFLDRRGGGEGAKIKYEKFEGAMYTISWGRLADTPFPPLLSEILST